MERICDEIIQLIIYELNDPTALILTSRRFLWVSQDPYVRAHYFLTRYGHMDAMFWALGRGKLLNEKVIDILLSSGAHISRYLVQVAIQHYYRTPSPFIKTAWVRSMPLKVFSYFAIVAARMFDEIPVGKNEDDGSIFSIFLKESRHPSHLRSKKWEDVRNILEKYRFIPFSMKDPLMVQLPIALAVEPRLLPYAEANGFRMDTKYRDFVFRKMFEKQPLNSVDRADEIVRNVRELKRLDSRMFLSRTVAAEVCMEAKSNESAYRALKVLDRAGDLLFPLTALVTDLIKLFVNTRSITNMQTVPVLRQLYTDFPSTDLTVRTVMLLTVILAEHLGLPLTSVKNKLESLGLHPLTRQDLLNVMTNPFIERPLVLLEYAKEELGMGPKVIKELVQDVVIGCLSIGSKGKTICTLMEVSELQDALAEAAVQRYTLSVADLPPFEDEQACGTYEAPLCRDFSNTKSVRGSPFSSSSQQIFSSASLHAERPTPTNNTSMIHQMGSSDCVTKSCPAEGVATSDVEELDLGVIGQDTLSAMIRQDEMAPTRSRRRPYYYSLYGADTSAKLSYPSDHLPVGQWVKENYPANSPIMAVFLTHAIINNNNMLIHVYLNPSEPTTTFSHVPITLKHFKLLAHLGRAPHFCLYHEIELGAEFYFSEDDYLSRQASLTETRRHGKHRVKPDVKKETSPPSMSRSSYQNNVWKSLSPPTIIRTSRRRPRRTVTATVTSYLIPDSDDEAIVEDESENAIMALMSVQAKKRKVESNLQRWIKHLSLLLAEEQRKYKDKRKRLEKTIPADGKLRVTKTEFHKSLTTHLRSLRKVDLDKRKQLYGPDAPQEDYTDDDDDGEYRFQTSRPSKRRRTNLAS